MKKIASFINLFQGKLNILTVDDENAILEFLQDELASPLLHISMAGSFEEACTVIKSAKTPWHCWISDIAMVGGEDGLKLLETFSNPPFVIYLSGLGSMDIASRAMERGAYRVFDKNPAVLETFRKDVAKVVALAFFIEGRTGPYFDQFKLLTSNYFTNKEEWAHQAFISERQLDRICRQHTRFSPRQLLSLYYTLEYVISFPELSSAIHEKNRFYEMHIEFVVSHLDSYRKIISS